MIRVARRTDSGKWGEAMMAVRDRSILLRIVPALLLLLAVPAMAFIADPVSSPDGAALYRQRCASCHDNPDPSSRTPSKAALAARAPNDVFDTVAHGLMAPMASGLNDAQLDALVVHLTGKAPVHAAAPAVDPMPQSPAGSRRRLA